LRVFRIFGLSAYVHEYYSLILAIRRSGRKILIFLSFVLVVTIVMGTIMFVVEGPENGFTSIPTSIYWAITTMTTVGFGDITPKTGLGRLITSFMMLVGWGTLAVPTGIVTVELGNVKKHKEHATTRSCQECLSVGHLPDAVYCMHCGVRLPAYRTDELPGYE
jgi:voltage-gated potassium channel